MADTNKDGMMSKQEFMNAAGMRYDAMMAKMKKMPADKSKVDDEGRLDDQGGRQDVHRRVEGLQRRVTRRTKKNKKARLSGPLLSPADQAHVAQRI